MQNFWKYALPLGLFVAAIAAFVVLMGIGGVYVWVNGAFVFLLADPRWFLLGAAVSAALDLWCHSRLGPRPDSALARVLGAVLILPSDHAWHHATDVIGHNFGANLSWWDRLHGTLYRPGRAPDALGVDDGLTLGQRLFRPYAAAARAEVGSPP